MARQGISKDQVYTAASELRDEGITPTVQSVRERIGSGSYSTISAHLAEWKAENAAQGPADIPPVPEKVQGAFAQIWATAARSAQEDVEAQKQALEALRREMDKERAEMAAEIERLEKVEKQQAANGEKLAAERDELKEALGTVREETNALRIENARLEERLKASETRGDELKDQMETLQEQFAEISKRIQPQKPTKKDQPPTPPDP